MPPAYLVILNLLFLAFLYFFLWRAIKTIYIDIYERPLPYAEAKVIIEKQREKQEAARLETIKSDTIQPGRIYGLTDSTTIGRSTENEIVLRDPLASHQHARIIKKRDGYYIMDLDSTNGTFIGRTAIDGQTALKSGTKIRIGSTTFKFSL